MKKETGIILFVVGLIIGFGIGAITVTAMQPSKNNPVNVYQAQTGMPPAPGDSPESYASSQQADQQAAEKNRLLENIETLKFALKNDPNNLDVLIGLGNSYFDVGQHYAAIDHYEKALAIDPNLTDVIVDLAIMFRRTGKIEKALEQFDRAIGIDAGHFNAILNKAVVYRYDVGDYKKALEVFKKFLEIAPKDHPMIMNAKNEVVFIEDELKKGHTGPTGEESHEGHDHD